MKARKLLIGIAAVGLATSLAACSGGRGGAGTEPEAGDNEGALVGIAMPTQTSERWIDDGNNVVAQLEELGYETDLQYANDDIPTQVSQIENMIAQGAKALIIASIDGTTLTDVLESAASQGIPVIAYDRLINGTENVDYYASFDNFNVGVQQGTSLLTGLGVLDENGEETGEAGPFNVELFAGSNDDNNATFFWNGAMEVLEPYIEDGTLVVPSGQVEFEQASILRWLPENAQDRMENLVSIGGGAELDGVLSAADVLSQGIIAGLESSGAYNSDNFPVVTGQDAVLSSVKMIASGEQYSTIFKDTRELADVAVNMVDALLNGDEVETNNDTDYDNGEKVVPAFLLDPVVVTEGNITEVLVDSGYYTEDELQ